MRRPIPGRVYARGQYVHRGSAAARCARLGARCIEPTARGTSTLCISYVPLCTTYLGAETRRARPPVPVIDCIEAAALLGAAPLQLAPG